MSTLTNENIKNKMNELISIENKKIKDNAFSKAFICMTKVANYVKFHNQENKI